MNRKIVVIIANWNGEKFLSNCLNSISNQTYSNYKIILVDNGSSDDSVNFVRNGFPNVQIIELERNTGFAAANNTGIRKAFEDRDVKYVVPLNNDTEVDNDFLSELVRTYHEYSLAHGEKVGSVAPKILKYYEYGKIDSAGILVFKDGSAINRGMNERDGENYNNSIEVFGASACACLYTREALEEVAYQNSKNVNGSSENKQYFDEDYFAYYEDVDLALRLRLYGWKSIYAPKAKVQHVHSATGISYSPFKSFHIHRNQYYNLIKDFPFRFLVMGLVFMLYRYWLLTRSALEGRGPSAKLKEKAGSFELIRIVLSSWYQVLVNFPQLLRKRKTIQRNRKIRNDEFAELLRNFEADLHKMIFDV